MKTAERLAGFPSQLLFLDGLDNNVGLESGIVEVGVTTSDSLSTKLVNWRPILACPLALSYLFLMWLQRDVILNMYWSFIGNPCLLCSSLKKSKTSALKS